MIPSKDRTSREVAGTLVGEEVVMGIRDEDMAHVMSLLTDPYADAELAVIREYATNGRDAHVEAGQARPIEVSTPTELRPTLTIQDWGTGLNAQDIRKVYSQYGASTRRESDDATGMLGIGSKSALAYTDQFTVTGVKDGVRTIVAVSRDEDGRGVQKIIREDETGEPNGVTIAIPTPKDNDIADKAADFFSYWQPGTVLLDGEDPSGVEGFQLTDDLVVKTGRSGTGTIVMGNVPYPANLGRSHGHLVAWVPIGACHPVPSREALQDSALTERCIEDIQERFDAAVKAALQREADESSSRGEALRRVLAGVQAIGGEATSVSYEGQPMPSRFAYASRHGWRGSRPRMWVLPENAPYYNGGSHEKHRTLYPYYIPGAVWITDFVNQTFSKVMREKLDQYVEREGIEASRFILTPLSYPPQRAWLESPTIIPWETIKAERLEHRSRSGQGGTARMEGRYEVYRKDKGLETLAASEIVGRTGRPPRKLAYGGLDSDPANLFAFDPGYTVVKMAINRFDKFLRQFPNAKPIDTAVYNAARRHWERLDPVVQLATVYTNMPGRYHMPEFDALVPLIVQDPELREWVEITRTDEDEAFGLQAHRIPDVMWARRELERLGQRLADRYPLADGQSGPVDHLHFYVNAVYRKDHE